MSDPPIVTVNLGRFEPFSRSDKPRAGQVDGLRFARGYMQLRGGKDGAIRPRPRHGAFVAIWESESALDAYEQERRLPFADGYALRLGAVNQYLIHPLWGELVPDRVEHTDGPLVVMGYAHPRPSRMAAMLRASKHATAALQASPSALAVSGFNRGFEGITFTMWRDLAGLRKAVTGAEGHHPGHLEAMRARKKDPFMKHETFVRFTPLTVSGLWDGRDPLAGLLVNPVEPRLFSPDPQRP